MLPQLVLISVCIQVYCRNELPAMKKSFTHESVTEENNGRVTFERIREMMEQNLKSKQSSDVRSQQSEADETAIEMDSGDYCSTFKTCFECVNSVLYPCDWCHYLGCTNMAKKLCPYAPTIRNSDNILKVCPYIQHQGPILLSTGIRTHISVKLHAPDPILYDMDITCQIKLKNRLTKLKGMILKDSVYCYPVKLDAEEFREKVHGSFKIKWDGFEPYSNEVPLIVYNCEGLADECDTCGLIDVEFGCGWCDELRSCVTANKCDDTMNWSLNRLTCKYIKKKMFFV